MRFPTTHEPPATHSDWVLDAYREHFHALTNTQLHTRLSELSARYGSYIAIKRHGLGSYHTTFSQHPGFLLAESICQVFPDEGYVLACLYLEKTDAIHIVIVVNGDIYTEQTLNFSSLNDDEFAMLSLWNYPFKLVLIDFPEELNPNPNPEPDLDLSALKKFEDIDSLKPYLANASRYCSDTLFEHPDKRIKLIAIDALRNHTPKPRYLSLLAGCLTGVLLAGLLIARLNTSNTSNNTPQLEQLKTIEPVKSITNTPYSAYQEAIATHLSPQLAFSELRFWLTTLISVSGWQLRHIDLQGDVLRAELERDPNILSPLKPLSAISQRLGSELEFNGNTVRLVKKLPFKKKAGTPELLPLLQTQLAYIDTLNRYMDQPNIQFSPKQNTGDCQRAPLHLVINQGSLLEWDALEKLMTDYPITLEQIRVQWQANTLHIELHADLWGSL